VTCEQYDGPLDPLWRGQGNGTVMDVNSARLLREITFGGKGAELGEFGDNWKQPFYFHPLDSLAYGLWQAKGGPCGILAAVQAHIIKHLLYGDGETCDLNDHAKVKQLRRPALAAALAEILWRAGAHRSCVVCLQVPEDVARMQGQCARTSHYRPDKFTELLTTWSFDSHAAVLEFLTHNLHMLEHSSHHGVVSFFYSVLLSKGLPAIYEEMDNEECTLVGKFGYCTMEFLNLALTGFAKSNVFDGDKDLSSGSDIMILGGVAQQSDIGQLTLFEVYGSVEVGSFLKSPRVPIWVICSESHFSTVFSAHGHPGSDAPFDLLYYDELARQEDVIRFTVDPNAAEEKNIDHDPPLELVLGTKWPKSSVNWNGTEVIH